MTDTVGCYGTTIKVARGHYFDVVNPSPDTIDIGSIAASLSKICRFGGHCPCFYSVAEHCIHATELAIGDGVSDEAILRAILLHDATEAYVGDMVKPLKVTLPQFNEAESRIAKAVASHFDVDFDSNHTLIKYYDHIMLKAEKAVLWPKDDREWVGFENVPVRRVPFKFYYPPLAERVFIDLASELGVDIWKH